MIVKVIPPEDPADVRAREGFDAAATWYAPIKQRPKAFKSLHGRPEGDSRSELS